MSNIHEYPATVTWSGGRDGAGTVAFPRSGVSAAINVPTEFGGPGGGTNPEELLAGAVSACYSVTFGIIAVNRKLPFLGIETSAVGHVEQNGASFVYTHMTLKPVIRLASDATDEHVKMAEDMAHKADLYCIITNAVRDKVKIEIDATIVRE